ncbi:hypothetical protein AKJ64_04270 [candidate division MSBL1 archaeon SCGC-AAA259E17]|uniref:Winged helix-turn helix domain-containing protein n=1 Tax=candidate division MSBL1 archaeon SCGC-AAA259E17 TaxID=1698263 RepID=A0A133UCS9_9EURY|nr:hypothetical protein AKJ64_04270 [candidate division MSBL1 archaeon SCGC-AAA259E17]
MSKKKILHREVPVENLKELRGKVDDPRVRDRITAVIMEERGYERREMADILSVHRETVRLWIKRFDESGIEGLWDKERPGRPSKLTESEKEQLREDLEKSPQEFGYESEVWSTKMVLDHLLNEYEVEYHPRYIQRFLRSLGFELKKPRPEHYRVSEEDREKYYRLIEDVKGGRP